MRHYLTEIFYPGPAGQATRGTYKLLAFVFIFLAFRLGCVHYSDPASFIQPDSYGYMNMARTAFSPGGMISETHHALRMPGYPLFLAGIFKLFGESVAAVQAVQVLLSLFSCWFLFRIAEHYLDKRAAWLVLFLLAVSYDSFSQEALVLSESLYTSLILAAFYLLLRDKNLLSGLLFAAGYFVRQEILVFIVFAAVVGLYRERNLRKAALFCLPLVLFLFLWGVRNYRVTDRFFTGTTASYRHLYYSNVYVFNRLGWKPSGDTEKMPEGLNEFEENSVRRGWCVSMFSQQNLPKLAAAPFIKLGYFLYPFLPAFDVTFFWVLPFWLLGMALLWKKLASHWQLYGMFTVLAALIAIVHAIPRTRGIFYPFILIFAACGLLSVWDKGGRYKAWLALWSAANICVYFLQEPARALLKQLL